MSDRPRVRERHGLTGVGDRDDAEVVVRLSVDNSVAYLTEPREILGPLVTEPLVSLMVKLRCAPTAADAGCFRLSRSNFHPMQGS
jgi:hypothetical protein